MFDDLAPAQPWELAALCRNQDPIFWDTDVTDGSEGKKLCAICPSWLKCLTAILEHEVTEKGHPKRAIDRTGIWGGLDPDQRAALTGRTRGAA
jgi:hypothetical protein